MGRDLRACRTLIRDRVQTLLLLILEHAVALTRGRLFACGNVKSFNARMAMNRGEVWCGVRRSGFDPFLPVADVRTGRS